MPPPASNGSDEEALASAVRESRNVLDHRIAIVSKMDDLAMHTLRSSVVVICILVSAAGIAGPEGVTRLSVFSLGFYVVGTSCLFGAVVFGLATLSSSSLSFGISESHRRYLIDHNLDYEEWAGMLLDEYRAWDREMNTVAETNSQWLHYELWTFSMGIVSLGLGTGVMAIRVVA